MSYGSMNINGTIVYFDKPNDYGHCDENNYRCYETNTLGTIIELRQNPDGIWIAQLIDTNSRQVIPSTRGHFTPPENFNWNDFTSASLQYNNGSWNVATINGPGCIGVGNQCLVNQFNQIVQINGQEYNVGWQNIQTGAGQVLTIIGITAAVGLAAAFGIRLFTSSLIVTPIIAATTLITLLANMTVAEAKKAFDQAINQQQKPVDPLIFDLDGDGKVNLTNLDGGTNFDINNDGFAQKIAWVANGDGVLCLDRNGNGIIDNGLELFGENTIMSNGEYAKSGIEALADLDSNKDGKIDANDEQFANLKFLKGDGTLVSMADAGIISINLTYANTNITDANGNRQVKSATFTREDGTTGSYGEFMLGQDHFNSIPQEWLEVSDDVAELPEIFASGWVHTLQQTIARDASGELQAA